MSFMRYFIVLALFSCARVLADPEKTDKKEDCALFDPSTCLTLSNVVVRNVDCTTHLDQEHFHDGCKNFKGNLAIYDWPHSNGLISINAYAFNGVTVNGELIVKSFPSVPDMFNGATCDKLTFATNSKQLEPGTFNNLVATTIRITMQRPRAVILQDAFVHSQNSVVRLVVRRVNFAARVFRGASIDRFDLIMKQSGRLILNEDTFADVTHIREFRIIGSRVECRDPAFPVSTVVKACKSDYEDSCLVLKEC